MRLINIANVLQFAGTNVNRSLKQHVFTVLVFLLVIATCWGMGKVRGASLRGGNLRGVVRSVSARNR